jgi:hypothetical protein
MADARLKWTADARYFEYSNVANRIGHQTPKVPTADFDHSLYEQGQSRIVPLDLSEKLLVSASRYQPESCANLIRIRAGERTATAPDATGQIYFVIRGNVRIEFDAEMIPWTSDDLFNFAKNVWLCETSSPSI